jgi:hypothetical protein
MMFAEIRPGYPSSDTGAVTLLARSTTPAQDPPELLRLPFDHYSRYALSRRIVGVLRHAGETFRILDVGGHSSPLKHFLPGDYIVLSDIEPVGSLTSLEFRFDEYVRCSGAALPFADASFDVVTAHDTLEHVPPDLREQFLREVLRVASRFVIVGGPMKDPEVNRAEERIGAFVRKVMHWDQPFLEEHLALGLPGPELVEGMLRERDLSFVKIPNGNLSRWLFMMGLMHYLAALEGSEDLRRELDTAYNLQLAPRDSEGICYRQCYVIACDRKDAGALRTVSSLVMAQSVDAREPNQELAGVLSALESHSERLQEDARRMHERLASTERELFEVRSNRDELVEKVRQMDEKAREMNEHYTRVEKHLRRQLRAAESTIGYRAQRKAQQAWRRIIGE